MDSENNSEVNLSIDLRQYLKLLINWAWLFITVAVLSGGIAYFVSKTQRPIYQATATMLINEAPGAGASDYNAILTSERLARTYSQMLTRRPVIDEVARRLDITIDPRAVDNGTISVQLVRDTQLIEIRAEDPDPVLAADIANMMMQVFSEQNQLFQNSRFTSSITNLEAELARLEEQIANNENALSQLGNTDADQAERQQLENELTQFHETYAQILQSYENARVAEAQTTSNVILYELAVPENRPVRPRVLLNTALAGFIGGITAIALVLVTQALDDTIRNQDDVKRFLNLPIFGLIPKYDAEENRIIAATEPRSPISDAYRFLRANIHFAGVDQPIKRLLITSTNPAEGKSTLTTNLGVVFAQHDFKTLILDTDFRRPNVHKLLDTNNSLGLSNVFSEPEINLNGTVRNFSVPNLSYITTGAEPPNPTELLASKKMRKILDKVSEQTDILLIDTPPMMVVTDAAMLAPLVDGVLLVVQPGMTKTSAAQQVIDQLKKAKANVLGVVMVNVELKRDRYKAYYHNEEEKPKSRFWRRQKS